MTEDEEQARFDGQLWLFLIVLLAAILRLAGLWSWGFEQDELYTIIDARDWGAHAQARGAPGILARPLYYILQHGLLAVFPPTPFSTRLPAAIFGVLGVWLTWLLAERTIGRTAGLVAAFLAAISPWHLYLSQFARYWTLVYCFAALSCLLLVRATASNAPSSYRWALLALIGGSLTHPTFLFPLTGVVLALTLVDSAGRVGWHWPTRQAWLNLWGPFIAFALIGFVALSATGHERAIQNWGGRGLMATLRLVPAIVQRLTPEVTVAVVAGAIVLWTSGRLADRRLAALTALGTFSTVSLLFVASFRTDIYGDYAVAALPLGFLAIGGGVQRLAEGLRPSWSAGFAIGASALLAAAVLPGTVSHYADGSRHDYRPAYELISRRGPEHPVIGWPAVIQAHYAPSLDFRELKSWRQLVNTPRYWLITSYQRYGIMVGEERFERWIDLHCRRVLVVQRTRLDYRDHRVDLHWCGPDPVPGEPK